MKIDRAKNAARNIVFDGSLKLFDLLVPLVMRSVILYYLGVEYMGLSGLFTSIFSFLNLAELGVGGAMIFSMYKPIAEDDTETICALMKLYRTLYRIIGLVIAVAGFALSPFLNRLVRSGVPEGMNLYILYYMNLASTVLTYWLFAYKNCLLHAHQRTDVGSKIGLIVNATQNLVKIFVLVVFRNYYLYLATQLCSQIVQNIIVAGTVSRLYPDYVPRGRLSREKTRDITHRVRDLFTAKFSGVILNSADTLVISSHLGLEPLALYQNYFYIVTALRGMLNIVIAACKAGIGNSLITENVDKNFYDLRKLTFMFNGTVAVCASMLLCMYQPFMRIWMGEAYLLSTSCVLCFVLYFYVYEVSTVVTLYKDAAGIWHKDRFRPLVASLTNLGLNLATVNWLGLYGVLLSTVVSVLLIELPWLLHNLFHEVFPRAYMWKYIRDLLVYLALSVFSCTASWFLCGCFRLNRWLQLIVCAGVSFLIPCAVFALVFVRTRLFRDCLALVIKTVRSRTANR